jgi:hypothetical protein
MPAMLGRDGQAKKRQYLYEVDEAATRIREEVDADATASSGCRWWRPALTSTRPTMPPPAVSPHAPATAADFYGADEAAKFLPYPFPLGDILFILSDL